VIVPTVAIACAPSTGIAPGIPCTPGAPGAPLVFGGSASGGTVVFESDPTGAVTAVCVPNPIVPTTSFYDTTSSTWPTSSFYVPTTGPTTSYPNTTTTTGPTTSYPNTTTTTGPTTTLLPPPPTTLPAAP